MRVLHPPEVFYTGDVLTSSLSKIRMDRMMERIVCDRVSLATDQKIVELSDKLHEEEAGRRSGEIGRDGDPTILFTNYKLSQKGRSEDLPRSNWHFNTLSGLRWLDFRDRENIRTCRNVVCQSGYEFHSAYGCLHRCDYCFLGNTLMVALNLEELRDHLDGIIEANPWQSLYKFDNQTDNLCFEPEYGASKIFVEYFARKPHRYLMLYTKSDNVDHLLELDHQGKTIVCWTLSCDRAAEIYEDGAPSTGSRIEAARKCQDAGYNVRFRFSPIIPIRNWKRENEKMIEELFSKVDPDIICLETLTHMDAAKLRRSLDLDPLDPNIISQMDEQMSGDSCGPFPHEVREDIYRFFIRKIREVSPKTPMVTCLETPEMWKALDEELDMSPDNYICCCGPSSTPENPLFSRAKS